MRYFSHYSDETWEVAKAACMSGKGFDSIENAIEYTKFEGEGIQVPFVIKDETGLQVWPRIETPDEKAYNLLIEVVQLARSGKDYKKLLPNLNLALKDSPKASDMCISLIKNLGG